MAFTEKLKKEVMNLADGKCVICHEPFVEIHHIIPQNESGPDTIENAAPLCAGCHDKYGDSPSKRKQIIEFRERWYQIVEKILTLKPAKDVKNQKAIAIYHLVYEDETFENAANAIIELLSKSQNESPNSPRMLFLDIDGHRNSKCGYDHDMFELMKDFLLGNLIRYFTEMTLPIIKVRNPNEQSNDISIGDFKIYASGALPKELEGKLLFSIQD